MVHDVIFTVGDYCCCIFLKAEVYFEEIIFFAYQTNPRASKPGPIGDWIYLFYIKNYRKIGAVEFPPCFLS